MKSATRNLRIVFPCVVLALSIIAGEANAAMSPLAMSNARVQSWSEALWTLPHERDTISTKRSIDQAAGGCTRFDRYTIECAVEEDGTWTSWDHWTNRYDKHPEWCIASVRVHKDQYGLITERTLNKSCE